MNKECIILGTLYVYANWCYILKRRYHLSVFWSKYFYACIFTKLSKIIRRWIFSTKKKPYFSIETYCVILHIHITPYDESRITLSSPLEVRHCIFRFYQPVWENMPVLPDYDSCAMFSPACFVSMRPPSTHELNAAGQTHTLTDTHCPSVQVSCIHNRRKTA